MKHANRVLALLLALPTFALAEEDNGLLTDAEEVVVETVDTAVEEAELSLEAFEEQAPEAPPTEAPAAEEGPMPVLTERFFRSIAVAWSPESPSATPAETCIVRRDWRVFERFSTSTDSHFADEKSTPSSDVHLSPVPHSALGNLTRTQFAPSRSTFAL